MSTATPKLSTWADITRLAKYFDAPTNVEMEEEISLLPALTGTPKEIQYGREARIDYMARWDFFQNESFDNLLQSVADGKHTEEEAADVFNRIEAMNEAILSNANAAQWEMVGTMMSGHPREDTKYFMKHLRQWVQMLGTTAKDRLTSVE